MLRSSLNMHAQLWRQARCLILLTESSFLYSHIVCESREGSAYTMQDVNHVKIAINWLILDIFSQFFDIALIFKHKLSGTSCPYYLFVK